MSSFSTYSDSASFTSDIIPGPPLQVDDSPLYSESNGLSPESSILTMRNGKSFQFPAGLSIRNNVPTDKVRVLKAPRVRRRPKNTKPDKNANPIITAPLSKLTERMVHIPIKDMEAWVNRTVEVRRREVAQKNGKIARPMNSFMLYRSAYAERTKKWCSQDNHQVVSRVSGQSWRKEPSEVREKYELLAVIERDNHQRAHPEYKFAPNKTQTPPRKKRQLDEEDSDADESGYHAPSNASPVPHKIIKAPALNSGYNSRESTPFDNQDSVLSAPYRQSQWPVPASRHLPPRLMTAPEQQHGYFVNTQGTFPSMMRSSEDSQHTGTRPSGYAVSTGYSTSNGLAGIPGNIHQDLLRSYGNNNTGNNSSNVVTTTTANNVQGGNNLDPQLLSSHQTGIDMRPYTSVGISTMWHPETSYMPVNGSMGNHGMGYSSLAAPTYAGIQQIEEGQHGWDHSEDDGIAVPEVGKDFDQWIHSQNHHPVYGTQ